MVIFGLALRPFRRGDLGPRPPLPIYESAPQASRFHPRSAGGSSRRPGTPRCHGVVGAGDVELLLCGGNVRFGACPMGFRLGELRSRVGPSGTAQQGERQGKEQKASYEPATNHASSPVSPSDCAGTVTERYKT